MFFVVAIVFDEVNDIFVFPYFERNQADFKVEQMQLESRRHRFIEFQKNIIRLRSLYNITIFNDS